jgi:uncharacterized protein with NRDE domain
MCLLIFVRGGDGALALAANRDERYDRPSAEPFVWPGHPRVLAGRDELAGGTWLAVNDRGAVAAVTNRPSDGGDDPARPSRGELPLLACRCASAAEARERLAERLGSTRYNGFNLLVADADAAFVIQAPGEAAAFEAVRPGIHVTANGAWDDRGDPRVGRALELLIGLDPAAGADELVPVLMDVCRDSQPLPNGGSLCLRGPAPGTVSSTVLTVDARRRLTHYLHATGPPCEVDYRELLAAGEARGFAD